jgi:hypothetical protein
MLIRAAIQDLVRRAWWWILVRGDGLNGLPLRNGVGV